SFRSNYYTITELTSDKRPSRWTTYKTQVLRARIEALSSKITAQRQLLKNLERDKSRVQAQLNAALDPIARLPLEISSEIFLQTLPPTPERPAAQASPMLLLNVCRAWTDIAISIPQLWTGICVVCPLAADFEEGFRTWLQRAGSRLLSISLRGRFREDGTASLIWEHAGRFKHLEICDVEESYVGNVDPGDYMEAIDLFGGRSPERFPSLETLTIRGCRLEQEEFSGRQILQLLRLAPSLIECTFEDMRPVSEFRFKNTPPMLVLKALRRMTFGEGPEGPQSDDGILKYLTLPALQTLRLSLTYNEITSDDLLSLFRRSSPPLEELALGDDFHAGSVRLYDCLQLVPSLVRLEMWHINANVLGEFLNALRSSSSLVPNLHNLKIVNLHTDDAPDSCWEKLLRVLSSRPSLRIVDVAYRDSDGHSAKPSANVIAAFRDLAQQGLQIYIGVYLGPYGRTKNLVVDAEEDSSDEETASW
ncbi:hypothetical protein DFH06DRAFT_293398, partial [Mycena polygramma]